MLSPEQIRQLDIAARLHLILKRNEELPSFQRDDARAFAQGMKVLIEVNTRKGRVDERQLIEDMKFFMIDQHPNLVGIPANLLHGFGDSNAAYNLMGGPRLGTIGWSDKYWDHGRQLGGNGKHINQAHHFAAFLIAGLENPHYFAGLEAQLLDGTIFDYNQGDLNLSELAIRFSKRIRSKEIAWGKLPEVLYFEVKD